MFSAEYQAKRIRGIVAKCCRYDTPPPAFSEPPRQQPTRDEHVITEENSNIAPAEASSRAVVEGQPASSITSFFASLFFSNYGIGLQQRRWWKCKDALQIKADSLGLEAAWRAGHKDRVQILLSHHPQLSLWSVSQHVSKGESVFSVPISVHPPSFEAKWTNRMTRSVLRGSRDMDSSISLLSSELLQKVLCEAALGLQPSKPSKSMRRLFATVSEPEVEVELTESWQQAVPLQFFLVEELLIFEGLQQLFKVKGELPLMDSVNSNAPTVVLNTFLRLFAHDYCLAKGPSRDMSMAILTRCDTLVSGNHASFMVCFEDYDMTAWDSDDELTQDYIACEFVFDPDWRSGTFTAIPVPAVMMEASLLQSCGFRFNRFPT